MSRKVCAWKRSEMISARSPKIAQHVHKLRGMFSARLIYILLHKDPSLHRNLLHSASFRIQKNLPCLKKACLKNFTGFHKNYLWESLVQKRCRGKFFKICSRFIKLFENHWLNLDQKVFRNQYWIEGCDKGWKQENNAYLCEVAILNIENFS